MFKEKLYLDALRFYAGQHVVDRVNKLGAAALKLGGETHLLTVMVIDSSYPLSARDKYSSDQMWDLYVAHRQWVVDCVNLYGGVIESITEDGIIVLWGLEGPGNHAVLALNCAAQLLQPRDDVYKDVIGVSTGEVYVGNFGTAVRGQFASFGNEVNFARRLIGNCSRYSLPILISESVMAHAGDVAQPARLVDSVRIKGKEGLTDIFTLANIRGLERAPAPEEAE